MTVYVNMDDKPVKDRISPLQGIIEFYDIHYAFPNLDDEQRAIIPVFFLVQKIFCRRRLVNRIFFIDEIYFRY